MFTLRQRDLRLLLGVHPLQPLHHWHICTPHCEQPLLSLVTLSGLRKLGLQIRTASATNAAEPNFKWQVILRVVNVDVRIIRHLRHYALWAIMSSEVND